MKKIVMMGIVALLVSVPLSAEVKKTKYKNGKTKFERNYVNGKLNGASKAYYESGKLKTYAKFSNGKLHGMTTGFYENGAVKAEIPMYEGKTDGFQKEFYRNGQLMSVSKFQNGVNVGAKKIYYSDGNLKAKLYFNDYGILDGTTLEYYPDGNKRYTVKVEEGVAKKGYVYDLEGERRKMTPQDFSDLGL